MSGWNISSECGGKLSLHDLPICHEIPTVKSEEESREGDGGAYYAGN